MNLQSWMPNGLYGWIGAGLIAIVALYHRRLTSMAMIGGLALGLYLYLVVDQTATA